MKTYEITVRVTHDVVCTAQATSMLKAANEAMRRMHDMYGSVIDVRCMNGKKIEEVKHED